MIVFPNAKINIGLFVTHKRDDGFHNIESIFYPIGLSDILEIREAENKKTMLHLTSKNSISDVSDDGDNTVLKVFNMIRQDFPQIKDANICLFKNIPVFAGLGGGSADATYMIKLTDYMFNLNLSQKQIYDYASKIGSDCPFFIENSPQFVYSRGEKMEPVSLSLSGYYIVLVKPNINISTKEAYQQVHKTTNPFDLRKLDIADIHNWKNYVKNDFEVRIFEKHPDLLQIKQTLYDLGALYTQMSGSGSTVYGIFDREIDISKLNFPKDTFIYTEKLK